MATLPALVAVGLAFPGFGRDLLAQQSASIRVSAYVTSAYSSAVLRPAAAPSREAEPARHLQRLPVAGVGVLEVEGAAGARVWVAAGETEAVPPGGATARAVPGRASRLVCATIAYPGV